MSASAPATPKDPDPPKPPREVLTYSGLVLDPDDQPLRNVTVTIASTPPVTVYTTSDGTFVADVLKQGLGSGIVVVRYRLAGYEPYSRDVVPDVFQLPTVKLRRRPDRIEPPRPSPPPSLPPLITSC